MEILFDVIVIIKQQSKCTHFTLLSKRSKTRKTQLVTCTENRQKLLRLIDILKCHQPYFRDRIQNRVNLGAFIHCCEKNLSFRFV